MTMVDYLIGLFAMLNVARVIAYVPQIVCIWRDRNGAAAVSVTTWALFAASHLATAVYAWGDWLLVAVFISNTLGCTAIAGLALRKRWLLRRGAAVLGDRAGPAPPPSRPVAVVLAIHRGALLSRAA